MKKFSTSASLLRKWRTDLRCNQPYFRLIAFCTVAHRTPLHNSTSWKSAALHLTSDSWVPNLDPLLTLGDTTCLKDFSCYYFRHYCCQALLQRLLVATRWLVLAKILRRVAKPLKMRRMSTKTTECNAESYESRLRRPFRGVATGHGQARSPVKSIRFTASRP